MKRNISSGVYFVRARVNNVVIQDSLETTDLPTALSRLATRLEVEREGAGQQKSHFKTACGIYLKAVLSRPIREVTKKKVKELVNAVSQADPDAPGKWLEAMRGKVGPHRFNALLDTMRGILGRDHKQLVGINKVPTPKTELLLPTTAQTILLFNYLQDRHKESDAVIFLKLIAFTGGRPESIRHLHWEDIDWERDKLFFRHSKTHPYWTVLLPQAREFLLPLRKKSGKVCPISGCKDVLIRACKHLGLPQFSPYDFRHLYATVCIESGVDIPTVASWMGHNDGGALMLKTYRHLRDEHSLLMSKKVRF